MTTKAMIENKRRLGVYIHIPFCRSKCLYCDFCSAPTRDSERISAYVKRLVEDIKSYKSDGEALVADTVYFGGGTPTLMSGGEFSSIMAAVRGRFEISDGAEITSECNPKTVDFEKLCAMRDAGINRLSIGMQSADGAELRALGRTHTFADVQDTVDMARRAGFHNISLDIMYGIPSQNMESLDSTLDAALSLDPEHLSLYALKIEEGTPFFAMQGGLNLPDEDLTADMYSHICERLAERGYNKYEISNFARAGLESRHNLKYWQYDDYWGFGASAHSFVCGKRIENSRDVEKYIAGESIICSEAEIGVDEQMNEYVMLAMRLSVGVDAKKFAERFGVSLCDTLGRRLEKFSPEYVIADNAGYRFTEKGFLVSNYILSEVLDF